MRPITMMHAQWKPDRGKPLGKNLFDTITYAANSIAYVYGSSARAILSPKQGTIIQTETSYQQNTTKMFVDCKPNTRYTFSANVEWIDYTSDNTTTGFKFYYDDGSAHEKVIYTYSKSFSFPTAVGKTLVAISSQGWGYSGTVRFTNCMLEEGTTATEFEPYIDDHLEFELCKGGYFSTEDKYGLKVVGKTAQDGTPTPDAPVSIQCVKAGTKINCHGKNLFDISKVVSSEHVINNNDGTISVTRSDTSSGVAAASPCQLKVYAPLLKDGKTYTLSANSNGPAQRIYLGSGKMWVFGASLHITEDDLNSFVYWYASETDTTFTATISNIQIEEGDTATEYESYISGGEITTPCDLYEGDIWYPMSGKVERYSGLTEFTGDEGWTYSENIKGYYAFLNNVKHSDQSVLPISCSHYETYGGSGSGFFVITTSCRFYNVDDSFPTVESWQEFLSSQNQAGTPVTLLHELVNPTVEQYDPQYISAPTGTAIVTQIPEDLTASLSATMLKRR